ncbi:glycosyltransferase family 39 protein [Candidatus Sumerlaeota bacterium]|nr:glycosyltransferase family 39 protein [Candidatus Sumerlaeota bacterium]
MGALSPSTRNAIAVFRDGRRAPYAFAFCLVVGGGAWLRLAGLGRQPLWLDEIFTLFQSEGPITEVYHHNLETGVLPLFFWIASAFQRLSENPAWLRLPSALFGILTIVYVWHMARFVAGRWAATLAAGLLALSPYHLFYSQEYRMYALMACLATVSTYYAFRAIHPSAPDKGSRALLLWLCLTILSLYTSMFNYVVVVGHVALLAYSAFRRGRPARRDYLVCVALLALSSSVALVRIVPLWGGGTYLLQGHRGGQESVWSILRLTWGSFTFYNPALSWTYGIGVLSAIPWLLRANRGLLGFAALVVAVPVLVFSLMKPDHFFDARYMIPVFPLILALSGIGWTRLLGLLMGRSLGHSRGRVLVALLFLVCFGAATAPLVARARTSSKPDWKSVALFLHARLRDGDLVFTHPPYSNNALLYHLDANAPKKGKVQLERISSPCTYRLKRRIVREIDEATGAWHSWRIRCTGTKIALVAAESIDALDRLETRDRRVWFIIESAAADQVETLKREGFRVVKNVHCGYSPAGGSYAILSRERQEAAHPVREAPGS